jgi:hypothetical protein
VNSCVAAAVPCTGHSLTVLATPNGWGHSAMHNNINTVVIRRLRDLWQ